MLRKRCAASSAALITILVVVTPASSQSNPQDPHAWQQPVTRVGNVFTHLTVMAPGVGSRSETGIGALIPWADRLWAIGYVAHIRGEGIGLYEIREDLSWRLHPEAVTGTFTNRFVHWRSDQVFIGPHAIDAEGNVRTIESLAQHRLTATTNHLSDPDKTYFLTMEGELFEVHTGTLEVTHLYDLAEELELPEGSQPHFKAAHAAQGRLVVANNTYEEPEFLGKRSAGRLAEWDGEGPWRIVERNPFIEVSGKQNLGPGSHFGNTIFAVGWDRASVILRVLHNGEWSRYRLPRGSHSWDHTWNTEWMRIREVQTERYLMDAFGLFYDLPALIYDNHLWGVRPIASHLRIIPDFVYFRGLLVLAGDQTDNAVGQPQSGLWLGDIDDLASFGKPIGWGAVWREEPVEARVASDPFLMTGFDKKVVHLSHDSAEPVIFTIEVDFLGNGRWKTYREIEVAGKGYSYHVFPDGFSTHWIRLKVNRDCNATAQFFYR